MKIYFLKRAGKNWFGNFNPEYEISIDKYDFWASLFFFRKKDAELYKKKYDGKYGNPFEVWSAEVKEDNRDNRKIKL